MNEKSILNETLVALSALPETMVWRNNTGQAWQGERIDAVGRTILIEPDMVVLRKARPVRFGLPGSADIIGVSRGRAIAPEIKTATGPQREQQRNFERAFVRAGGLYVLARSVNDAVEAVRSA